MSQRRPRVFSSHAQDRLPSIRRMILNLRAAESAPSTGAVKRAEIVRETSDVIGEVHRDAPRCSQSFFEGGLC